ncbi:MAG: hypothetical protein KJZ74_08605 [Gemmatimonadales bacterium]|nr:hypothetical protein [Gemmatimonadota bacterium]MCL4213961.1 hypothetical protein [Gemmatimonadales bacterium]
MTRDRSGPPELAPELFGVDKERAQTSGQFSAAAIAGLVLLVVELFAAPLVLGISLAASLATWWLLDAPWSGHRRHARRRGITTRLLYLSTLMLVGLWLGVMFIFRASDPALSSGFTTTLPVMVWGVDVSLLESLNGMERSTPQGTLPLTVGDRGFAPFSLFVHGAASTIAVALVAYAVSSARRRVRRVLRDKGMGTRRDSRQTKVPPRVR